MKTKRFFVFGLPVALLALGLVLAGCDNPSGGSRSREDLSGGDLSTSWSQSQWQNWFDSHSYTDSSAFSAVQTFINGNDPWISNNYWWVSLYTAWVTGSSGGGELSTSWSEGQWQNWFDSHSPTDSSALNAVQTFISENDPWISYNYWWASLYTAWFTDEGGGDELSTSWSQSQWQNWFDSHSPGDPGAVSALSAFSSGNSLWILDNPWWYALYTAWVTGEGGGDTVVTNFFLNGNVTAPVRGASPDTMPINTTQYTGTIVWRTADGSYHTGFFGAATVYQAVVTLTAKTGYTFTGVGVNSFIYYGATVTNGPNSGVVTITFPPTAASAADTVVTLRSLDSLVIAPARGVQSNTSPIDTMQYTGTLFWRTADDSYHSGAFAAATVYQAVVTLTAKSGYTFMGMAANSFVYSGATLVANAVDSGLIIITFPPTAASTADTVVTMRSLDSLVTSPARGVQSSASPIDTTQYTGTLFWRTADDSYHSGAFAAATVYEAVVTLTAKSGYTFMGVAANSFVYSGATLVANAVNSGLIIITFPPTAASTADTVVTMRSLDSLVTPPVRDAQPSASAIDTTQYTGTVAWQTAAGSPHYGAFGAATVYQAVVTLTAKSGYTFTGVAFNSFTYSGAATVANAVNSGVVTITFPPTAVPAADTVVTMRSLDSLVTAPARDVQPNSSAINTTQYTGTVAWQTAAGSPHSGAFGAGTVYRAVVTLTAKSGYTFTGVGANGFAYSGATTVANAANSGVVTITFPATDASGSASITLVYPTDAADNALNYGSITISGTQTHNLTVIGDFDSYRWRVDGSARGSGKTFTLDAGEYAPGIHQISLEVTLNGAVYSKSGSFRVQ
jgi:hypothetical protein